MPIPKHPMVLIISEAANRRVSLSRELTRKQWVPVPVATWQRASEHGLSSACAVVTDAEGLSATGADLAILGLLPEWVPVIVVEGRDMIPRWARHRVQQVPRSNIPAHLEVFKRQLDPT